MLIAYANAEYRQNDTRGRKAHIGQFITNAVAQEHEIWGWPGNEHPNIRLLPRGRLTRLITLRRMDALYLRLQENPPSFTRYALKPYRQLIGSPIIVWEFNTVPEFNLVMGRSEETVQRAVETFRHFGCGCDLAVCVSEKLSEYVQDVIGIHRVLTVPNGSDPELFNPDVQPVKTIQQDPNCLNVVTIGSQDLAWHDFRTMCKAARLLWENAEGLNIKFHVIGGRSASMKDTTPNVHYYGSVDYEAIPQWLASMDVGLCLYLPGPADFGSPLKLFDYMSSGLAVVGTYQTQTREVFRQLDQLDLLVPAGDPESLANVLIRLASDRERIRHLGRAGRQLVIDFYNWRRAVEDIMNEIKTIFDERSC